MNEAPKIDEVNERHNVADLENENSCVRLGNLVNVGELETDLLSRVHTVGRTRGVSPVASEVVLDLACAGTAIIIP